ncbi:MAG: hypothetical protein H6641_01860 [Caldilineaceae bacterium]|nr:hypothetical protein [Caldilineaceae bacterium]
MRFPYTVTAPAQNEFDSLPRLPLTLQIDRHRVEAVGLVDSGATVNVLPYDIGLQLGELWEDRKAIIKLAGNLGGFAAQPVFAMATIGDLAPIRLVFAWTRSNSVSLILGQMNFFMEFEVCFFRKQREFEIKLSST